MFTVLQYLTMKETMHLRRTKNEENKNKVFFQVSDLTAQIAIQKTNEDLGI